jgi:hypothetical protein
MCRYPEHGVPWHTVEGQVETCNMINYVPLKKQIQFPFIMSYQILINGISGCMV